MLLHTALVTLLWCAPILLQVEQILNLRTDLMEAAEKLRRSEAERQTLETDITSLRQQVRSSAAPGVRCRQAVSSCCAAHRACHWSAGALTWGFSTCADCVQAVALALCSKPNTQLLHCLTPRALEVK